MTASGTQALAAASLAAAVVAGALLAGCGVFGGEAETAALTLPTCGEPLQPGTAYPSNGQACGEGGACQMGVCVEPCADAGGCPGGMVCTAPVGTTHEGACVPDCTGGEACQAGLECQALWYGTGRACLPPGVGFDAGECDDQDLNACRFAGLPGGCYADRCWLQVMSCPDGATDDLFACLPSCSTRRCPDGMACEVGERGQQVCLPGDLAAGDVDANTINCGAWRHACGQRQRCTDGLCLIQYPEHLGSKSGPFMHHHDLTGPPRYLHGAAATADGLIVAAGGLGPEDAPLDRVDVYDPSAKAWTPAAPLSGPRSDLQLVRAGDGRLYAIGGLDGAGATLATVEVLDPGAGTWSAGPSMAHARAAFAAAVDGEGRIWVLGGTDGGAPLDSVERLAPGAGAWEPMASLPATRHAHAAVFDDQGVLFVFGGTEGGASATVTRLLDPGAGTWGEAAFRTDGDNAWSVRGWVRSAGVLGTDGRVLAIGGYEPDDPSIGAGLTARWAHRWTPALDRWEEGGVQLTEQGEIGQFGRIDALWGAGAARLPDGRIAIVGGNGQLPPAVAPIGDVRILGPTVDVTAVADGWVIEWTGAMAKVDVYVDTFQSFPVAHFYGVESARMEWFLPRTDPPPQRLLLMAESDYRGVVELP